MRLSKFTLSMVALVAPLMLASTPVSAKEAQTFEHEGVTYSYRVIERGDKQVIVGASKSFGQSRPFKLVVQNGKVRGDVNGNRVAFLANEARSSNVLLASD